MEGNQEKRIVRTAVPSEAEGSRLDMYLSARFTYRSRAEWQKTVRAGEILLNGLPTRPSRLLHAGETLSFELADDSEPEVRTDFSVLHETPDFLVVSKPGNLPVHPAGCYFANTLLMLLRKEYGELFVVNRLDRETSGLVLLARNAAAARKLSRMVEHRNVKKQYVVFVHGVFPREHLSADGFLSPDPGSEVRKKRRYTAERPEGPDTEDCRTDFTLLASCGNFSMLECLLHTGRFHQIRATLFSLGFPVVGDKLYGPDDSIYLRYTKKALTDEDRKRLVLDRQALHAWRMEFPSPFDRSELSFEAPLPPELTQLKEQCFLLS